MHYSIDEEDELEDKEELLDEEEILDEDGTGLARDYVNVRSGKNGAHLYGHLRYRDSLGCFASPIRNPNREMEILVDRKIKQFEKEYQKKIDLPFNEKVLLLRLVDDFKNTRGPDARLVSQFPRLPYHLVLKCYPWKRSMFSQFISRMIIKEGLVIKVKHGHKLYLRITKKGLDKVFRFWEEYPGESWHMP